MTRCWTNSRIAGNVGHPESISNIIYTAIALNVFEYRPTYLYPSGLLGNAWLS